MAVTINSSGTYNVVRPTNADAESTTGWNIVKLEGAGGTPSLVQSVGTIDLFAEGSDALACQVNKTRVQIYFDYATGYDFTTGSTGTGGTAVPDGSTYIWNAFLAAGVALTKANGGLQISLGDGTNTSYWNVAGSNTYSGGLVKWAANTTISESENSGTAADLGDIIEIGFVCDVGTTTARFNNMVVDAFDIGDGLDIEGTTTSDTLFLEAQALDATTAIGVLSESNGIIFSQGSLEFGGTAQTSIAETLVFTDTLGGAYTYQLDITGTIVFTNTIVNNSGVVDFNFDSSGATAFTMTGGSLGGFNNLDTGSGQTMSGIVFQSGGISNIANTISNSSFNQCGLITLTGSLDTCTIDSASGTIAVSTAISNIANISDTSFISDGTGNGLEITGTATNITLDNLSFSGYSTSVDADKAIYVNIATGSVELNISGGSGISVASDVRTAGATITVVAGAVNVQALAALKDGTPVENARVYLKASNGTGPFPFEETVTSITRSGTTATVSHTAHGMGTNDKAIFEGITDKTEDNYSVKQITVSDANTYTYTTTDSGSTNYTGTIKTTFVALKGLTNASGIITLSRVYTSNQPVVGWSRKSTSSPFLQEGVLVGEVDSTTGFSGVAVMLTDE